MLKMKNNIFKLSGIFCVTAIVLNSCGPKKNPPLVYFPDMYFPVAYDPLMKAEDAYSDHENEIPLFAQHGGATALESVPGTVSQNADGVVENVPFGALNTDDYNKGYEEAKNTLISPLNPQNREKDLERGKHLYEITCAACHGVSGDGQGSIVQSGAYAGVPKYADRDITIGSVHFVLENGKNAMGSYAGQLKPGDRWRVAMYVINAFKGGLPSTKMDMKEDKEESKNNTK